MKRDYEPCPFCGKRKAQVKQSRNWGWFVACQCNATGTPAGSKEGAIANWNRRPLPEQERLL